MYGFNKWIISFVWILYVWVRTKDVLHVKKSIGLLPPTLTSDLCNHTNIKLEQTIKSAL